MPKENKPVSIPVKPLNVPERVKKIADSSLARGSLKDFGNKLDNRRIRTAAKTLTAEGLIESEILSSHIVSKEGKKGAAVVSFKDSTPAHLADTSSTHTGAMEDIAMFMSGKGVNIHRDDFDTLDLFAQHIISA